MNYRIMGQMLGRTLLIVDGFMLPALLIALGYEEDITPFLLAMGITLAAAVPLACIRRGNQPFYSRDAFVAVAAIWLATSLSGALPFVFTPGFGSFIDCIFESASGFTTTGASILTDIEALPRGILFWRSTTHFLGGMGVLVLATAILPASQQRIQHLMRAEVPGPTADKLVPRLAQSSKILYGIYVCMTLLEALVLLAAGLPLYDAANVALATAGTGGFAVKNLSIAGYANPTVEIIVTVFMFLFGVNFSVYFLVLTGKLRQAFRNEELWCYFLLNLAATGLIAWNTFALYASLSECVRTAAFQVVSISTTTGFMTADFDQWPQFSKAILMLLLVLGGCAGSTAGGVKCSRLLIVMKSVFQEVNRLIHPRSVARLRLDGKPVADETINSALRFITAYAFVAGAVYVVLSLDGLSTTAAFTAVLTCLSNVGPGLAELGPACNFSICSELSKGVLSLCMIAGRLEIFPLLVFLSPGAWKRP